MSEKKTKLFRIRKTVCKMLNARGYLVAQAELDRDKDSFTEEFGEDPRRDALTLQFDLREDPTQHIFVFFPDEEKVGVKTIKEYAKRMILLMKRSDLGLAIRQKYIRAAAVARGSNLNATFETPSAETPSAEGWPLIVKASLHVPLLDLGAMVDAGRMVGEDRKSVV